MTEDEFTEDTRIKMTPFRLEESPKGHQESIYKLGALWVSSRPDHVNLIFQCDCSDVLKRVMIKVDGEMKVNQDPPISDTTFGTRYPHRDANYPIGIATTHVTIKWSTFDAMMNGADVRLRMVSNDGYSNAAFHNERNGKNKLKLAKKQLHKFVEAVQTQDTANPQNASH